MKVFSRQQANLFKRHNQPMMFINKFYKQLFFTILLLGALFLSGCGIFSPKTKVQTVTLLKTDNATQSELVEQVNHFAKVNSLRAKVDLKFEDNSYAEVGIAEKYKTADGEIVVQRPANILLKVQIPVIKTDVVQMTSDGEKFRVAILQDGGSGKYKKFVLGTNNADYSVLQKEVSKMDFDGSGKELKKNVNAFSNLRPQHFTDAMLMRPIDTENYSYLQSTILQEEDDAKKPKQSPLRRVLRGYYLLDELRKNADGSLSVSRRFWFDRVGGIRLARQQIFDDKGEIESDIVYGNTGSLTDTGEYNGLPLRIDVTRPKERYKMSLTYQSPETVSIGQTFPKEAFVLENHWNLQEVDLDKEVQQTTAQKPVSGIQKADARNQ
ncbi:MAG: hypothetical protein M3Q33_13660 [Acidobacteriota bacterium]|nr:hypothetical protein [Acidobacteriota bacterium]